MLTPSIVLLCLTGLFPFPVIFPSFLSYTLHLCVLPLLRAPRNQYMVQLQDFTCQFSIIHDTEAFLTKNSLRAAGSANVNATTNYPFDVIYLK